MRRYAVIYADPPWRYSDKRHGFGGAEDHYSTMALEDIKAIAVPAMDDCALFMWATMPLLPQAFEVLGAWGFKFKTSAFTWVKQNKSGVGFVTGLGFWTRSNTELCLLATRGRPRPVSHRVHSVVVAPRTRHSQKPDEVRRRIVELLGRRGPAQLCKLLRLSAHKPAAQPPTQLHDNTATYRMRVVG